MKYSHENLTIWRNQLYTLENDQVDLLMTQVQPGDGVKTYNAVVSGDLPLAGMFPQLMQLASKSSTYWHPCHVSRGSVPLVPHIEEMRLNFLNEVTILRDVLSESGIDQIETLPADKTYARLLTLGVFCNHTLQRASEIETDSQFADTSGYGVGSAKLYGHRLERVSQILALNEKTITDTESMLDAAIFLMQFGESNSPYETLRNQNVANQLLASLAGGSFAYEDMQNTNTQILNGLAIGGVPRDFKHWGGTRNEPPHPDDIPNRFLTWQSNTQSLLEFTRPNEIELDIARQAADYNEIHPWREANGRSVTVEVNKLRAMAGLDPIYAPLNDEIEYIFALGNPERVEDINHLANFFRSHELPRNIFIQLMEQIIATGNE